MRYVLLLQFQEQNWYKNALHKGKTPLYVD